MKKPDLIKIASHFIENSEDNYIKKKIAISDAVVGMKIWDDPIFAFGDADDEHFLLLKKPSAIGNHFKLPKEWLPQAKTVISFFLPYTESVKNSNCKNRKWPSEGWLHGRFEGQKLLEKLCLYLNAELINSGYMSVVPGLDERFVINLGYEIDDLKNVNQGKNLPLFSSNWSERHVAFTCGLGSFGLSKGLITEKGIAGRFGSIVTDLYLKPDSREYENIYEYCSMCGACAKQCPVNAISIENGKNHKICSEFLSETAEKYKPRYGCGKCQVNVPCESFIPHK